MIEYPTVLYRFSKRCFLESFLNEGVISFGQAKNYKSLELTEGQRDNEQARDFNPDLSKTVFMIDDMRIPHLKDIKISQKLRGSDKAPLNYYLLCCSLNYNEDLYDEFDADTCIEITNVESFLKRIADVLKKSAPLDFGFGGVSYYDSASLPVTNNQIELVFMKPEKYLHQKEYRIIIVDEFSKIKEKRFEISIGSLKDICNPLKFK